MKGRRLYINNRQKASEKKNHHKSNLEKTIENSLIHVNLSLGVVPDVQKIKFDFFQKFTHFRYFLNYFF